MPPKPRYSDEQLLKLILSGPPNREIIKKLGLSPTAQQVYRNRLKALREKYKLMPCSSGAVGMSERIKMDIHYGKNTAARLARDVKVDVAGFMAGLKAKEVEGCKNITKNMGSIRPPAGR